MSSTYPDLDPYFKPLSRNDDIAQCAIRACEEVLFDSADDIEDPFSSIACESEIREDERVESATVTIDGADLRIAIVTNDGATFALEGTLTDDRIEAIIGSL